MLEKKGKKSRWNDMSARGDEMAHWPFFCFLCSVEVDTIIKCVETSRILDFQFWNNNTKFRKSLQ